MENNETKVVIRLLAGALFASLEMNSKRGVIYAVRGPPERE